MDFVDLTGSDTEDNAANLLSRFDARPRPHATSTARSALSVQGIPTPSPSSEPMPIDSDNHTLLPSERTMQLFQTRPKAEQKIHAPRPYNPARRSLVAARADEPRVTSLLKLGQIPKEVHRLPEHHIDLSTPTPPSQTPTDATKPQASHAISSRNFTNRPSEASRVLSMVERVIQRANDLKDLRSASNSPNTTSPRNMPSNAAVLLHRHNPTASSLALASPAKRTYDGAIKAPSHITERGCDLKLAQQAKRADHNANNEMRAVPRDRIVSQCLRPAQSAITSMGRLDLSASSLPPPPQFRTPSQLVSSQQLPLSQPLLPLPRPSQLLPHSPQRLARPLQPLPKTSQPLSHLPRPMPAPQSLPQKSQIQPASQIPPFSQSLVLPQSNYKSHNTLLARPSAVHERSAYPIPDSKTTPPLLLIHNEEIRSQASALFDQINNDPPTSGRFTAAEDQLIILLRTRTTLSWPQTERFFPFRKSWHSMQSRYSTSLTHRQDLENLVVAPITTRFPGLESACKTDILPSEQLEHEDSESDNVSRSFRQRKQINYNIKQNFLTILDGVGAEDILTRDCHSATLPDSGNLPQTFATLSVAKSSLMGGLRRRELGLATRNCIMINYTYGPLLTFTGTSGDVNNVAWHPDGVLFAVGSTALTDTNSMQYNEANNLLLGDISYKTLRELPDHAVERPGANVNPNSAASTQEPFLFTTISNVQFSRSGDFMFSAGYDNLVRVWQIPKQESLAKARCVINFKLKEKVDVLSVNQDGIWAAGCSTALDSVHVLRYGDDMLYNKDPAAFKKCSFSSARAKSEHESGVGNISLSPSCLKWGQPIYGQEKYLLGGFSAPRLDMPPAGEVCMWDVDAERRTVTIPLRNVFDVAWCPTTYGRFAVGCSPTHSSRTVKSAVRIYDSIRHGADIEVASQHKIQLDCPASDMNDVIFNLHDYNIVSAGCTDGTVYVWDLREPDKLLHRFSHGAPLVQLYDSELESRENQDTGIRFLSWNNASLFSGSSDGTVQAWNPYVAPEDAHIKQIAQLKSGVMAGEFSSDFSNLLLGEVDGSVSVLSVTHEDEEAEKFVLQEASKEKNRLCRKYGVAIDLRPGATQARKQLKDKEIKIRPLGGFPRGQAVQGKYYNGPLDRGLGASDLREAAVEFQSRMRRPASPCCLDHELMLTEEDRGDCGASQQRIPWALRHSDDVERQECISAACTGRLVSAEDFTDVVECTDCDRSWRVDVLGYTPLESQVVNPARAFNPCRIINHTVIAPNAIVGDEEADLYSGRARRQAQRFGRTAEPYHNLWGQQGIGGKHEAEYDFGVLSDRMGALDFDEIPEELQHETYVLLAQ